MSIPKIIHYCWFGNNQIPDRDKKCIESWKKFCPDYKIIEWNENNYDVTHIPYMKEAYEAKRWGFVPDYIRMDLIYKYGGIYMDTDVELIRPLDELLECKAYVGLEAESNCIGLGLGFGAEKGNKIFKELCDYYKTLHFVRGDGTVDMTPNPIIVTEYLKDKGYRFEDGEISKIEEITVFPKEYFCPQSFSDGKTKITNKTYSIHHYHASWQTEEEQKSANDYRFLTNMLGKYWGELVFQGIKTLKAEGTKSTVKKSINYLKKIFNKQ